MSSTETGRANAHDYDQVYNQLELLSEMSRDFASSRDIEASLDRAIHHIAEHVNAEGGALFLLEQDGEILKCHGSVGGTDIKGITLKSDQGIVGRCVQSDKAEMVRNVEDDPNFHKGVDEESGFTTRSILCAPMRVKGERIGAIELINKRGGDGLFEGADLSLLEAMSASAALAIHNARMADALVEQEKLARELELAAEIQRSLLPDGSDNITEVRGINIPARTVSGDFFDYFQLEDNRIWFNLGDVSGKGMNAALLMAKTSSLYRCLGKEIDQPGVLMGRVNAEICETATRGMFVTMAGGIYDPLSGIVRMSNAGHEPPLFRAADGTYTDFEAEMPPVGITTFLGENGEYPEIEFNLDGGALYIFTDGVTEGYLENGEEFSVEGVKELLDDLTDVSPYERLETVVKKINWGTETLRDDLTMMVIDDAQAFVERSKTRSISRIDTETSTDEGDGEEVLSLTVPSQADRLKLVRTMVFETARFSGCGEDISHEIVLAVDEALQNIIRHAYKNTGNGDIDISIHRGDSRLVIVIRDYADTVNTAEVRSRDIDDIRPGGLGVHFIHEVMDEVGFMPPPQGGGNALRMVKHIH